MIDFARRILRALVFRCRSALWTVSSLWRSTVTVSTKQGKYTLRLGREEFIGKCLYCAREFELEMITQAMALLRSEGKAPPKGRGTVLDVGANNGVISISMLTLGEVETAVAVEPEPRNFALLERNVSQNGLQDRVVCLQYAAADRSGSLEFELSCTSYGDHRVRSSGAPPGGEELYGESSRSVVRVESERLDDLVAKLGARFTDEIAVLWVDVQGFEAQVFRGAERLLSRGVPAVSEFWPYGIARSGVSEEEFCAIVGRWWSSYWVLRDERFVRYPIKDVGRLFKEVGYGHEYQNVVFI